MPKSFQPISGFELPRFAGVPTFMRLPHVPLEDPDITKVQIGLIGTPWDTGTTNRPGPRHGPRQLRDYSTMIRAQNSHTEIRPFELVNCADLGDVGPNPADINDTMDRISEFYERVKSFDILPLTGGGDHLCSLPILRGIASEGPLGMIHFDSHTDLFNSYFGGTMYTHGTPFRRALEENLIDPSRSSQIGLRGPLYDLEDYQMSTEAGLLAIPGPELHKIGNQKAIQMIKERAGNGPAYLTFDIDFIDPAFAPGTGTPEAGGFTGYDGIEIVRGLTEIDFIGYDMVEVMPPYDPADITSLLAANIMYEFISLIALSKKDSK